jgi:hypothetical protein
MEQSRSRPTDRPEPNRYMEIYEEMEYPFKKTSRINFFFIYDDILPPPGGLLSAQPVRSNNFQQLCPMSLHPYLSNLKIFATTQNFFV